MVILVKLSFDSLTICKKELTQRIQSESVLF